MCCIIIFDVFYFVCVCGVLLRWLVWYLHHTTLSSVICRFASSFCPFRCCSCFTLVLDIDFSFSFCRCICRIPGPAVPCIVNGRESGARLCVCVCVKLSLTDYFFLFHFAFIDFSVWRSMSLCTHGASSSNADIYDMSTDTRDCFNGHNNATMRSLVAETKADEGRRRRRRGRGRRWRKKNRFQQDSISHCIGLDLIRFFSLFISPFICETSFLFASHAATCSAMGRTNRNQWKLRNRLPCRRHSSVSFDEDMIWIWGIWIGFLVDCVHYSIH